MLRIGAGSRSRGFLALASVVATVMACGVLASTVSGGREAGTMAGCWDPSQGPVNGVTALALNPRNANTIYAGSGRGVFLSTDGGQSWQAKNSGLTRRYVISLAIDPLRPQTVYAVRSMASSE